MGDTLSPTERVRNFIKICKEKDGFKDLAAKDQTLNKCYRNWFMKTHPDKGGNEEEFQRYIINDLFTDNKDIYSTSGSRKIQDLKHLNINDKFFKDLVNKPTTGRQQSSQHTTKEFKKEIAKKINLTEKKKKEIKTKINGYMRYVMGAVIFILTIYFSKSTAKLEKSSNFDKFAKWKKGWEKLKGGKKEVFGGMGGMGRFYEFLIILCFIVTAASAHFGDVDALESTLKKHVPEFRNQSVASITKISHDKESEPKTQNILKKLGFAKNYQNQLQIHKEIKKEPDTYYGAIFGGPEGPNTTPLDEAVIPNQEIVLPKIINPHAFDWNIGLFLGALGLGAGGVFNNLPENDKDHLRGEGINNSLELFGKVNKVYPLIVNVAKNLKAQESDINLKFPNTGIEFPKGSGDRGKIVISTEGMAKFVRQMDEKFKCPIMRFSEGGLPSSEQFEDYVGEFVGTPQYSGGDLIKCVRAAFLKNVAHDFINLVDDLDGVMAEHGKGEISVSNGNRKEFVKDDFESVDAGVQLVIGGLDRIQRLINFLDQDEGGFIADLFFNKEMVGLLEGMKKEENDIFLKFQGYIAGKAKEFENLNENAANFLSDGIGIWIAAILRTACLNVPKELGFTLLPDALLFLCSSFFYVYIVAVGFALPTGGLLAPVETLKLLSGYKLYKTLLDWDKKRRKTAARLAIEQEKTARLAIESGVEHEKQITKRLAIESGVEQQMRLIENAASFTAQADMLAAIMDANPDQPGKMINDLNSQKTEKLMQERIKKLVASRGGGGAGLSPERKPQQLRITSRSASSKSASSRSASSRSASSRSASSGSASSKSAKSAKSSGGRKTRKHRKSKSSIFKFFY